MRRRPDTVVRWRVLADDVRAVIEDRAGEHDLTLVDVAEAVHASRRQVQRVLAAEGTTFEKALREACVRRAMTLLAEDGTLTRARLAELCGYRQAKSLRRAMATTPVETMA